MCKNVCWVCKAMPQKINIKTMSTKLNVRKQNGRQQCVSRGLLVFCHVWCMHYLCWKIIIKGSHSYWLGCCYCCYPKQISLINTPMFLSWSGVFPPQARQLWQNQPLQKSLLNVCDSFALLHDGCFVAKLQRSVTWHPNVYFCYFFVLEPSLRRSLWCSK